MATSTPPMSNVIVGSGECWLPFVQLLGGLQKTAENPTPEPESLDDLEQYLNRHRGNFRTLHTTKPKNQKERDYIKSGLTEPIALRSCDVKQLLPQEWVAETMLLSDILDFNEFQALDLLVTGEAEVLNYPCWARGLIAVNMYYEGRHALVSSLHAMARLIPGLTWGSRVSHKVLDIIKPFLDNLFADNLIDKILDMIPKCEVQKQIDLLDSNLALGDWRHRTEILKFLTGIRIELAQVVFCLAAQQRLTWKNTQRILEYLRHVELKRDVKFYKEDVLLICSVLYGLDNNINDENFDKSYALEFRKYLLDAESKNSFLCRELLEFFNLNYYTCVYKLLCDVTINYHPSTSGRPTIGKGMETSNELLGEDELEFKTDVFTFLKVEIFTNESTEVAEEEHIMKRFHKLFTEFINYMPMKLKDMKIRSEDAAKTVLLYIEQGVSRAPQLAVEYDSFLECMGTFYSMDKEYNLAEIFFSPNRNLISLSKFTRSLCHDSPPMFVCNVNFMTGLGMSYPSGVFGLIKPNGHNLSLEHFFDSIMKYLSSFGKFPTNSEFVLERDPLSKSVIESSKVGLRPHEVNGIVAYLKLIKTVCSDGTIKKYFADTKRHWIKLMLASANIRSLPREIRAEMLNSAATMIPIEAPGLETIVSLWDMFYTAHLIRPGGGDFRDELEERETRLESYILCNGFLQLLNALVKGRSVAFRNYLPIDQGAGIIENEVAVLDNYVAYVRDAVLMKLTYRTYRSVPERWETTALSISILSHLLDEMPILMCQFLSDCPILKAVLNILVDCTKVRELSTGKIPFVDQASYEVLNLIYQVLIRQDAFLEKTGKFAGGTVLHGIHDLVLSINIVTGRAEYLIALLKFIDKFNPDKHQELSLQILTAILTQHSEMEGHLYAAITSDPRQALMLEYTFSQCLANPDCQIIVKQNILRLLRCSAVHPAPNLGLFLLGVDKKIDFQQRDDKSRPSRSILHYILENVDELPDVFLTLLVLLRDDRLRDPLLRQLRATQFFVKYYMDSFSSSEMEIKDIGFFLKCVSIDLKNSHQVGPLGHILVSKDSHKFLNILKRVELCLDEDQLPILEFFEPEHVTRAMSACEYLDRDYKVKVVDLRRLEKVFEEQMKKLERTTALRLKKSVMGESKELLEFGRKQNERRRREASKVLLFDCWKQCLEVIILTPSTLAVAGMDFVTSILRLVVDKITNTEGGTEAFLRLGAETVLSLCGALSTFKEDLSESMLNLILTSLCTWTSTEGSVSVRGLLYPSILNIMEIMREQKKIITSRTNFAIIIDPLCKDCLHAGDTGKISSMYLLGEIINWSMRSGYGGRIPYIDTSQPLTSAAFKGQRLLSNVSFHGGSTNASFHEDETDGEGMRWEDISIISPSANQTTTNPGRFFHSPGWKSGFTGKRLEALGAEPLNSTVLPTDVRDKQHVPPGEWQGLKNNDTFLGFIQKQPDELPGNVGEFEEMSGFRATSNFVARSTIMNYMQTKGLVRNLISSLTSDDDLGLMDLFCCPSESIHLRSLLIFQARIHILNRFARTGQSAALLLQEDNLIPRLTDMHTFKLATRMRLWEPKRLDISEDGHMSIDAQIARSTTAQQGRHLDTIFVCIWSLLHSMEASLPINVKISAQIWRFIQINKESVVSLLGRCPSDKEPEAEVPEPLALFTSLLVKLPLKIPEEMIVPNDDVYEKIVETLKDICRKTTLSSGRAQIASDLLHFLHGYSNNPRIIREIKRYVPSRPVLISCMNYKELPPEANRQGATVGDILRLVQLAAHRIPRWDGSAEGLTNFLLICEIGLTLVYHHMDVYVQSPFPMETERRPLSKVKQPTANLQNDVAYFMEETLSKTIKEAVEFLEQRDPKSVTYIQSMFTRIRRLSLIRRI